MDNSHPRSGLAPDQDPLEPVLAAVGPRLRALRQQRGATLAQLAGATGISLSILSRLESGQRRPTLDLLLRLARAHQVALDELVGAPATGDPRVRATAVTRFGMAWLPLTRRPGGLQSYKVIMPPARPAAAESDQQSHEGYEWMYVLSGALRLRLAEHDLTLTPGEVAVRHPHPPLVRQPRPHPHRGPVPVRPPRRTPPRASTPDHPSARHALTSPSP